VQAATYIRSKYGGICSPSKNSLQYKDCDKAWIAVVPKGKESSYPFEIPPKGTVVSPDSENKKAFEHYYDDLRAYLMRDSEYVSVKLPPKVYEHYMKRTSDRR